VNYYAQCRREPETECTTWQNYHSNLDKGVYTHEALTQFNQNGWLCPGWEECSGQYEECTLSRCCADESFACYLNKTSSLAVSQSAGPHGAGMQRRWYAQCRPKNVTQTGPGSGSGQGAAGGGGTWVSPDSWMTWRDGLWRDANVYATQKLGVTGMGPAAVASLIVVACVAVLCTVACALGWRRQHVARVQLLEAELKQMGIRMEEIKQGATRMRDEQPTRAPDPEL